MLRRSKCAPTLRLTYAPRTCSGSAIETLYSVWQLDMCAQSAYNFLALLAAKSHAPRGIRPGESCRHSGSGVNLFTLLNSRTSPPLAPRVLRSAGVPPGRSVARRSPPWKRSSAAFPASGAIEFRDLRNGLIFLTDRKAKATDPLYHQSLLKFRSTRGSGCRPDRFVKSIIPRCLVRLENKDPKDCKDTKDNGFDVLYILAVLSSAFLPRLLGACCRTTNL